MSATGHLAILLHAHLPYVRHPEMAHAHEEHWLFEALSECYLPLLALLDRLHNDGIAAPLALSLSPTLLSQWADPLLNDRYERHLEDTLALCESEIRRTRDTPKIQALARDHLHFYRQAQSHWQRCRKPGLAQAFAAHTTNGLELLTTSATHAFLPLLSAHPESIHAQLHLGLDTFARATGQRPQGFWLPECGYYPGLENALQEHGIRYFCLETHGLTAASPPPPHGVYAPIACPNGLSALARDAQSSRLVWSAQEGYPGAPAYREFHCDLAHEHPTLAPHPDTLTGIKYYRIGTSQNPRQPYCPKTAARKAKADAKDFILKKKHHLRHSSNPAFLLAPFDAELFGHWWHEGPLWLEHTLRLLHNDRTLRLTTPAAYLQEHPPAHTAQPSASSWGEDGYNRRWLNEHNDWVLPRLHQAATAMKTLARRHRRARQGSPLHRALNQCARSLLLAQSSDWTFLLRTQTATDYASQRIQHALARFHCLEDAILHNHIDNRTLSALEQMDNLFPEIDFRLYLPRHATPTSSPDA